MPLWEWLLDIVGILLLLVLLYAVALIVRRRLISRHGGTFELSARLRRDQPGRGWVLGIGRYQGERLQWFRIFSLSTRPKCSWPRSSLNYCGRREPVAAEEISLYAGHVVVELTADGEPVELAMGESSLTGFQSWLEAGLPGASGLNT